MKYCTNCEEYFDTDEPFCPVCDELLCEDEEEDDRDAEAAEIISTMMITGIL